MRYRKIGGTDLQASSIGFGCWALGGHGYGNVSDQDSIKAIRHAISQGINFFDTADVYGFGRSEYILGQALGADKKNVIIASKFGIGWTDSGQTYKDTSAKRVSIALESSLKRLNIECIPLYQIHWPDLNTPIEDTLAELEKCQKAGKILHIGVSNFNIDLIKRAQKFWRIESSQLEFGPPYSQINAEFENVLSDHNMGVIAYGILGRGLISGKYNNDNKFGDNDTRSIFRKENPSAYNSILQSAKLLSDEAGKYNISSVQLAIRIALNNPHITTGIIGFKTVEQVSSAIDSFGCTIDSFNLNAIKMQLLSNYSNSIII